MLLLETEREILCQLEQGLWECGSHLFQQLSFILFTILNSGLLIPVNLTAARKHILWQ